MAGPLSIPLLHEGDRIGDWRHLFRAAVTNLLAEENGQTRAIQLLPAYINRRPAEKELIKDLGSSSKPQSVSSLNTGTHLTKVIETSKRLQMSL